MTTRKPVVKDHPNMSPSPEAPSEDGYSPSALRNSRAASEARTEMDDEPPPRRAPCGGTIYDSHGRFGSASSRASVARDDADDEIYGAPHTPSWHTEDQVAAFRSSRAGSEAPQRDGAATGGTTPSPSKRQLQQQLQYASNSQRSSRAGSEVPDRGDDFSVAVQGGGGGDSRQSSRAGSETPQRFQDPTDGAQRVSRGQSTASNTALPPIDAPSPPADAQPRRRVRATKQQPRPQPDTVVNQYGPSNHSSASARQVLLHYGSPSMPAEHIQDVERYIYHTVKRSTGAFEYYQLLHYPLDPDDTSKAATVTLEAEDAARQELRGVQEVDIDTAVSGEAMLRDLSRDSGSPSIGSVKEPSPLPRGLSSSGSGSGTGSGSLPAAPSAPHPLMAPSMDDSGGSSSSPSPHFDEAAFNATFDNEGFLNQGGGNLEESFSLAPHMDDAAQRSVSVLAMTTLPDPVSGVPVLGLCLGDYSGQVEYFEVSSSESNNKRIRKSKSMARASHNRSGSNQSKGSESRGDSCDSEATVKIMHDMRGREVARRHSHKAFVKSINALTSVAVEPCVKCLTFVRPHSSPSMISYLTANERVIKLYHVRREGFMPFSAFPYMEDVVGRTFTGSRYFARLPAQSSILPIKEYGPSANSIQALSISADGETFLSVEDLQVFWWSFEAADTTKATCIADLRPPSGALDEVEELVTAASFHPTHSSLFMLSRSSGVLNIGDLRDPPSREQRQYAITTQVTPQQNPASCPAYDEILCSISAAAFLSPDHVITRDYLSLKLWDLRKPDMPYAMTPVMNYVARYLDPLYENDSIFDRFPVAVDEVSGTVVTGLYDGAVAVWQPLSSTLSPEDALVHYRVDPFVDPTDTDGGGRVAVADLERSLANAWKSHAAMNQQLGNSAEDLAGGSGASSGTNGGPMDPAGGDGSIEEIPEPFTNKVLNVAVAPGGERFGYTYKNGRLIYVFERKSGPKQQHAHYQHQPSW